MVMDASILPWPEGAPPVALPNFLPCPMGWAEVDDGNVVSCSPFAAGAADACAPGQAHFPGEAGCRGIGDACPVGPFAEGLPADGTVIYVDPAAAAGGDGSRGAPFASLSELGWPSLLGGTTIALAKGEFLGTFSMPPGVHVVGACTAETVLLGISSSTSAVVDADDPGTPTSIRSLTIRGAQQPGLRAVGGAHLDASNIVIDGVRLVGAYASEAGSELTLTDVVVQNTAAEGGGSNGRGLSAQFGGRISGTRVVLDRNRDVGIFIATEGSVVALVDSVISNTLPRAVTELSGRGVSVQDGGRFEATRTLIRGNRELGLFAGRVGSELALTDVVIADTLPQGGGANNFGRGISIQDGARLETNRVVIEGSRESALTIAGSETAAVLVDTVIRNTEPELRNGTFGRGINIQDGSQLAARRLLIANNYDVGMVISGTSALSVLEDVTIVDTHIDAARGDHGYGMHVQFEARVEARGLAIRSSRTLGIAAVYSTLDLEDVVVHATGAEACTRSNCGETPFGYGVSTISSSIRMSDFIISDAATCGVFISGAGGEMDLARGVVTGAAFGACVQIDDYDVGRLTEEVSYVDNVQNLEATDLPVPEAVSTVRAR